jgi:hypothetical protein
VAEPITIALHSGTVILLLERAFALFIQPRMRAKENTSSDNVNSGEQDPAFWKQEFRSAVDEKLDQRVMPILERQTVIQEAQTRTLEGVAILVKELVETSRRRRR